MKTTPYNLTSFARGLFSSQDINEWKVERQYVSLRRPKKVAAQAIKRDEY